MGTAQSQYIDDVNFKAPKQSKEDLKIEAQRIAAYNEKVRRERNNQDHQKRGIQHKHDAIAIAELMNYLKAVATHASNLPLTTRDDPELGRTVSSLTAKEYATKAVVFIPSNVRVIGGMSIHYNGHSEYPSRRDLNISSMATDFSRSHGGACCNAMLKVLYDNGNEEADMIEHHDFSSNTDNLFDENEDESEEDELSIGSIVFDESDVQCASTITWAAMMRKMKNEMKELGHKQVPTISASRRFDLNEPFSIVPDSFDPNKNKKTALLVGCNYVNSSGEISTSHDDIQSMKDYIVNVHGFPDNKDSLTVLLDDGKHSPPTQSNIIRAFEKIANKAKKGDAVVIQFVGHGTRMMDTSPDVEEDCYDEAIFPSDFETRGPIIDTTIFRSLLAPMAKDVTVTILLDSTNTGVMFDMPYSWSTIRDNNDSSPKLSLNDNFSFVRILKVLKHVYEKSTCTENYSRSYDETICFESDSDDNSLCTVDDDASDGDDYDYDSIDNKAGKQSALTTIGGYLKPPKGPKDKGGSTIPRTGTSKKAESVQKRSDCRDASNTDRTADSDSMFSGIGSVQSLSAQNLYNQVVSALGQTDEPAVNCEVNEEDVKRSADYDGDDNEDYFVQDSYSNESGGGYL